MSIIFTFTGADCSASDRVELNTVTGQLTLSYVELSDESYYYCKFNAGTKYTLYLEPCGKLCRLLLSQILKLYRLLLSQILKLYRLLLSQILKLYRLLLSQILKLYRLLLSQILKLYRLLLSQILSKRMDVLVWQVMKLYVFFPDASCSKHRCVSILRKL